MTGRWMTADEAAVRIIISGGPHEQERLSALRDAVRRQTEGVCPECGKIGGHDDNGERGADLTFLCACGCQWNPEEVL